MKKVMFVFGIVFFALNSYAVASVTKSSKGAANCGVNVADQALAVQGVSSVTKTSEAGSASEVQFKRPTK